MILNLNMSDNPIDVRQINILALAHLGDAVYELLVRRFVIGMDSQRPGELHKETIKRVCASYQASAFDLLLDLVSEEELSVLKRGRNNHTAKVPRSAECIAYRKATGLECLFGYLYALERIERINELFSVIVSHEEEWLNERK